MKQDGEITYRDAHEMGFLHFNAEFDSVWYEYLSVLELPTLVFLWICRTSRAYRSVVTERTAAASESVEKQKQSYLM